MQPRHRLDLRLGDLGYGLLAGFRAPDPDRSAAEVFARTGVTGLVTLSVRSAWDLLLTVMDWPPGSEIVVSAIGHPDMATIAAAHGLRVVPVDVDPDTLAPSAAAVAQAVTDRTRAIMVVQLFGGLVDFGPLAAVADRADLLLVVDAAQAFAGPDALDHDLGDVWLYSFGLIKTCTAVGGALLITRDQELVTALERQHRTWPRQRPGPYARRLLRAVALLCLSRPAPYGAVFAVGRRLGLDLNTVINSSTRSFAGPTAGADPEPLDRLRHQPAPALVALLARRFRRYDPVRLLRRTAVGERVAAALPPGVSHPGEAMPTRTHWLFPVVVADGPRLVAELHRSGLDASPATSNLTAVTVPDRPAPERAVAMMRSIVYLPVSPELTDAALDRLLAALDRYAAAAAPRDPAERQPLDTETHRKVR